MTKIQLWSESPKGYVARHVILKANLLVFFRWQFPLSPQAWGGYLFTHGFVPNEFFTDPLSEWQSIYTSTFSHGGTFHLLGNMLFLYLFGDNVEDAMGKIRFALFYLTCGTAAALAQGSAIPPPV